MGSEFIKAGYPDFVNDGPMKGQHKVNFAKIA